MADAADTYSISAEEVRRRCAHGQQQIGLSADLWSAAATHSFPLGASQHIFGSRSIEYLARGAYVADPELWSARARDRVLVLKLRQRRPVVARKVRPEKSWRTGETYGAHDARGGGRRLLTQKWSWIRFSICPHQTALASETHRQAIMSHGDAIRFLARPTRTAARSPHHHQVAPPRQRLAGFL